MSLESLIQTALRCRPEVAARSATIAERDARLSEERIRPFVPLISVGYSAGGFGGGSNLADTRFGPLSGRGDFDAYAVWSLANFGFGNAAVQRQRRAQVDQAEADRLEAIAIIRREVADAFADVAAQRQQIEIAKRQLHSAEEGFRLDMQRSRNLEGRPIEVLDSADLLVTARLAAIQAAIGFDQRKSVCLSRSAKRRISITASWLKIADSRPRRRREALSASPDAEMPSCAFRRCHFLDRIANRLRDRGCTSSARGELPFARISHRAVCNRQKNVRSCGGCRPDSMGIRSSPSSFGLVGSSAPAAVKIDAVKSITIAG